jgi:hypothetical protein
LHVEDCLVFVVVTTSLLVLRVFHLIATNPINFWGYKLVFFPMKASIATEEEEKVEEESAMFIE